MSRRPLSLQARSLLAAGIALAAFLGLTGFALDAAIYETLRSALHDRLQSYVYGLIAPSDVPRSKRWLPPEVYPDPRFDQPGGNMFAGVIGPVERRQRQGDSWRSPSALGRGTAVRFHAAEGGRAVRRTDRRCGRQGLYAQSGVSWSDPHRGEVEPDHPCRRGRHLAGRAAHRVPAHAAGLPGRARRAAAGTADGDPALEPAPAAPRRSRPGAGRARRTRKARRPTIRSSWPGWPRTSTISSTASAITCRATATRFRTWPTA